MDHFFNKIQDFLVAGMLGGMGGISAYLYNLMKHNQPFKITGFLLNTFLAFFIGNVIGSFIPLDYAYRDGILMIAGYSCWPMLSLAEIYTTKYAETFIKLKMHDVSPSRLNEEDKVAPVYDPKKEETENKKA